jgi:hypothetical protein
MNVGFVVKVMINQRKFGAFRELKYSPNSNKAAMSLSSWRDDQLELVTLLDTTTYT